MNTEKRLKGLENALRALKTVCPVSASKVKTHLVTSQTFTSTNESTIRIKFTPSYSSGGNTITTLYPEITSGGNPVGYEYYVNEPQDGTGAVVIKVQFETYSPSSTYSVKVHAFGTSPGSFSQL